MRRKYLNITAFGTALVLSAALMVTGPAVMAEENAVITEDAEGSAGDEVETIEPDEEFDESEAVPAADEVSDEDLEAGNTAAAEGEELSELEYLQQFLESSIDTDLTNVLITMSDEDIEGYIANAEGFSKQAPEAWKGVRDELGARTSDEVKVKVEEDGDNFIATQNVVFEKADADFVYTFDKNLTSNLVINVNYPKSVLLGRAGLNTLMGLGTVFLMLVFLCFIISLFKYIPNGSKKKKAEEAPAPVPVRASAPEPEYVDETDDLELAAVIAAAIAAAEGTAPDGFVVRSIRRAGRSRR